jgi:hypothetical protein
MAETIDHGARAMAAEAKLRIEDHEDRCAERWAESRDALKEIKSSMSVTFRWFFGLLLTAMGSTIAGLAIMVLDHHK